MYNKSGCIFVFPTAMANRRFGNSAGTWSRSWHFWVSSTSTPFEWTWASESWPWRRLRTPGWVVVKCEFFGPFWLLSSSTSDINYYRFSTVPNASVRKNADLCERSRVCVDRRTCKCTLRICLKLFFFYLTQSRYNNICVLIVSSTTQHNICTYYYYYHENASGNESKNEKCYH